LASFGRRGASLLPHARRCDRCAGPRGPTPARPMLEPPGDRLQQHGDATICVPDQVLGGPSSAAAFARPPSRWSQRWRLIARSIAHAGQARSICRYWAPPPATFKAPAPALRDNSCSIAEATAQRRVLDVARPPATSSRRWSPPRDAKSCRHGNQGRYDYNSGIRTVSRPSFWSSADTPACPSSSLELEDRRCAGPAFRAYG
jgi:hypothetical protein